MADRSEPHSLEQVVERVDEAADHASCVSVGDMLDELGKRSFAPLMLVPALIVVSPVGGIPGLPTVVALIVALVAVQLLIGRDSVWLPDFLLSRSVSANRVEQVSRFMKSTASYVDALVSRRLTVLVEPPFDRVIAACILCLCLVMPPLEVIPFGNSSTGAAISVFALALIAQDGLLALIAVAISAGVAWLGISFLVG